MEQKDTILEEIHDIRDKYAKQFDYDLKKIFEHLVEIQEKKKAAGEKYASFPPKRPKQVA